MPELNEREALWVGVMLVVMAWLVWAFTGCTLTLPQTWVVGRYQFQPSEDGGQSGSFRLLVESITPITADAGPIGLDASSPSPDATSFPDSSVSKDSGPIGSDAGLDGGLYEPPCCSGTGYLPPGKTVAQVPLTRPGADGVTDPTFSTRITAFAPAHRHEYSQLNPWSHTEAWVLLRSRLSGLVSVFSTPTRQALLLDLSGTGQRWRSGAEEVLVWKDSPLRLELVSVPSGSRRVISFPFPSVSVAQTWESTSRNGKWTMAFVPSDSRGNMRLVGIDLELSKVTFDRLMSDLCPTPSYLDWSAPTPSGDGFVIQWGADGAGLCQGFEVFGWDGKRRLHVHDHHHHSDLGQLANGQDYLLTYENYHPSNANHPSLVRYNLSTGQRTDLRMIPWGRMEHVSCQGLPGTPCVVSASYDYPANQPLLGEVYLLGQDGSLLRLAQHRSTGCADYFAQPHAAISPSGKRVAYASTWGGGCESIQGFEVGW